MREGIVRVRVSLIKDVIRGFIYKGRHMAFRSVVIRGFVTAPLAGKK